MKNDFENSIKTLSSRARRVLADLSVTDTDSFLKITIDDLIKIRSCGKKTIAEIGALQESLSGSIQTSQISNALPECENILPDAFEALLGILSKRTKNILKSLSIKDLKAFLMLNSDQLFNCRHCGQKTINEILNIQSGIKSFVLHQINEKGVLKPEELIKAPCFNRISTVGKNGNTGDIQDIFADVNNPTLCLTRWVNELSHSKKQSKAFKLRKGMIGSPPMTLDAIGEQIGVTKERVRQMIIQTEKAATSRQHRLKPLMDAALSIVKTNSGMVSLEELIRMMLCKGKDGEKLKYATGLIKFFAGLKIWTDQGLKLENKIVFLNDSSNFLVLHLTSIIEEVASNCADEKIDDKLWSIDSQLLKDSLTKKLPTTNEVQTIGALSDAILDRVLEQLQNKVKNYNGRVYSLILWKLRFGNVTQVLDAALHWIDKPAHYREVYEYAHKWRPDISEVNAYAVLIKVKMHSYGIGVFLCIRIISIYLKILSGRWKNGS
jgi:hypothetical protein